MSEESPTLNDLVEMLESIQEASIPSTFDDIYANFASDAMDFIDLTGTVTSVISDNLKDLAEDVVDKVSEILVNAASLILVLQPGLNQVYVSISNILQKIENGATPDPFEDFFAATVQLSTRVDDLVSILGTPTDSLLNSLEQNFNKLVEPVLEGLDVISLLSNAKIRDTIQEISRTIEIIERAYNYPKNKLSKTELETDSQEIMNLMLSNLKNQNAIIRINAEISSDIVNEILNEAIELENMI